jgi:hypothetical protein
MLQYKDFLLFIIPINPFKEIRLQFIKQFLTKHLILAVLQFIITLTYKNLAVSKELTTKHINNVSAY